MKNMYNDKMQNKDDGNAIMTPLTARLWNRGAAYAWADVDIQETSNEYVFSFDIPESQRNNIKIWIDGDKLYVSGETGNIKRHRGIREPQNDFARYYREFRLPLPVDGANLFAQFVDGVLIVVIPKTTKAKINNININ
jgi:HSP20 family protein